jgi:hypothetical protein
MLTASADPAYRNAKRNPDKQNARIELDRTLTQRGGLARCGRLGGKW